MSLIDLKDITRIYKLGELDVPILKGITFSVEAGEMVALMGASGSGKSTLMNILGCLDRPTSGSYHLDGEDVSKLSRDAQAQIRNGKIGFVFQNFNLLARTSALDNVRLPLEYSANAPDEDSSRTRAKEMLMRVGLSERASHTPSQLSGGQQQRVAIARALINHPRILFADEPTGNLDSRTSDEVLELFDELNREGITIVLVTHEMDVAGRAKRIIRLKDGLIEGPSS